MATLDNEVIVTTVVFIVYFTLKELEDMLGNSKVGGYTAVRIETNGGAIKVELDLR